MMLPRPDVKCAVCSFEYELEASEMFVLQAQSDRRTADIVVYACHQCGVVQKVNP